MSVYYYFWIGSGEGGREGAKGKGAKREPRGREGGALAALDLQNRDNTTLDDERTPRRTRSAASGVRQAKQPTERDEDR